MKRITRKYTERHISVKQQVWLDASGHWTHDESKAHAFPDDEAEQRVRRIPHAEIESIENNANNEEKNDV